MPTPSAAMARPITGSRSVLVISATALTWPVFSAMRAMTAGTTRRMAAIENDGACQPTISLPADDLGVRREAEPGGVLDAVEVGAEVGGDLAGAGVEGGDLPEALVEEPGHDVAEDQREEDRDASDEALEGDRADDREGHHQQRDPLVLRPVDVGDHGREVEADEHDDGAGDDGRQHLVQHARAEEVDEHTHEGEHHTGDEDRARDRGRGGALLGADRHDGTDERRRGARGSWGPCPGRSAGTRSSRCRSS